MSGKQTEKIAGSKFKRIVLLLLCVVPITVWSYGIRRAYQGPMKLPDFSGVYFASRCALNGNDPYNGEEYVKQQIADIITFRDYSVQQAKNVGAFPSLIYLPTCLFVVIPFALLPWAMAQNLFMILIAGFLFLGGLLMWDLGGGPAPVASGWLIGFLLASSPIILLLGNSAGIAAGACVIAAWCFLKQRYEVAGVMLFALSMVIKPHDAGFVWLYLLLAGGRGRKRALQTLALTAVLGVCAMIWIAPSSPHWVSEIHRNLAQQSSRGGIADPGPTGKPTETFGPLINLQSDFSVFRDDPRFYNPLAYLVAGCLFLALFSAVLRKRSTPEGALLALGAVSFLTTLPVYHRGSDAKLLMLTIPACAMLWARKGTERWIALGLTAATIFVTSDIPQILLALTLGKIPGPASTLGGKLTLVALQPAPLVLLAAGCFYLWMYIRYNPAASNAAERNDAVGRAAEAATP